MAEKRLPTGLDLDALEREGNIPTPYQFEAFGQTWVCKDPDEVDWQTALDLDVSDPRQVLSAYLGEERYAEFASHDVPGWKIQKLLSAIDEHYNPGAPPGEGEGSPPS